MTDQRDDFYQPWLREPAAPAPAAAKRRYEPLAADDGLARDETVPLGIDVSGYVIDDAPTIPVADRVKPAARAASVGAAQLWAATRRGASAFAAWTIRLGARADVPARIAALEIPRRSGVVARRAGAVLGAASRSAAAVTGRTASVARRKLGKGATHVAAGLKHAAARGFAAGSERLAALRPAAVPTAMPPTSGLDRLLDSETPASSPSADATNLPLFRAAPPASAAEPATGPPPPAPIIHASADERPVPRQGPVSPGSGLNGGAGGLNNSLGPLPRWLPWGAAALLVLAATFWLGSRWGGSATDRPAIEAMVKDVILANPEIIPEALEKHQANQMATAIDAVRPILEKPFAGAWAGNARGDVTITVFTDYGCVYCRASIADIDRLVRTDKGVKLVYRELPIIAPQSKDAALAALAAARQGKYDAFHHAMFAAPGLDRAAIDAASTRAGVILDGRSDAGVDTRLFAREIDNNLALAQQIGVNATPTWIIGSRMLQGAVGFDQLRQAVAAARAAS